jgi:hypothetical protein
MDDLLEKSEALNSEFSRIFDYGPIDDSNRIVASWIMCSVSLEHNDSTRHLMTLGNHTTAIGVLRLQFESLTRAVWLFYAASDVKIANTTKNLRELSHSADQKPNNTEMLKAIEGKAPAQAIAMLNNFRDVSWKELNSFVHGGVHAHQRHAFGYPEPLLKQLIKTSNGLLSMIAMMAAVLTVMK